VNKRNYAEIRLHIAVAGWLDKHLRPPAWFTTFPAGGGGEDRGKLLWQMKLRSGVPDIFPILCHGRVYAMEIKVGNNKPSDAQIACHARLIECGVGIAVVRSVEDAIWALNHWAIPWSQASKTSERIVRAVAKFNQENGR
jgi:hypothetical protein